MRCGEKRLTSQVQLRSAAAGDVAIFFEHQQEPDAICMAAFPARDRGTFTSKWEKILTDPSVVKETILCDGQVAGYIVCWEQSGRRLVGYWLGQAFWGQGVASRALTAFLGQVQSRPLHAFALKTNVASLRVLQKCGFEICDEEGEEYLLQIGAG